MKSLLKVLYSLQLKLLTRNTLIAVTVTWFPSHLYPDIHVYMFTNIYSQTRELKCSKFSSFPSFYSFPSCRMEMSLKLIKISTPRFKECDSVIRMIINYLGNSFVFLGKLERVTGEEQLEPQRHSTVGSQEN